MTVSEVTIIPVKPADGLVAFASCLIDRKLFIGSIGVHKRLDGTGYRLTYPTKKVGSRQLNYFYPVTKKVGKLIEQEVIAKCIEIFERSDEIYGRHGKADNHNS